MKDFVGNSDYLPCSATNSQGRSVTIGTGGNTDDNCSKNSIIS